MTETRGIWFGGDSKGSYDDWQDLPGVGQVNLGKVYINTWQRPGTLEDPPEGANIFMAFTE